MSEPAPSATRGLPRESARELSGASLAARVLGSIPRRLEVAVGQFGPVTLTWQGYGAASAIRGEPAAFALSRGSESGRLVLDAALAGRIVAVALGAEGELAAALGRLGPGARGVVAGFVAGVLHAARVPLAVSLAPAPRDAAPATDTVVVSIGVSLAGGSGWAVLEAPRTWLDEAVRLPSDARELSALTVDAAVELARTTLAAGELAAVVPGDAVVFDGAAALEPGATWAARLVVGDHAAGATIASDGVLTLDGAFGQVGPRRGSDGGAGGAGRGETTALTTLPIEIVADLARVRLRGDEVVGLGAGAIVPLGDARHGPIVLRVGGQPWSEGQLAEVDGELAVRVARLLP